MTARIKLNPQPDGLGYLYGEVTADDDDYKWATVNIMPPATHWRGNIRPSEIDPVKWIVYLDGDEIARVDTLDDAKAAIAAEAAAA